MKRNLFLFLSVLLTCEVAAAQLTEYKTTDVPRPGENIAQPCDYQATFPAGAAPVKAAWVTYDRGADITRFYSDPDVLTFAKRNAIAMVLAIQCPASHPSTGEQGEMDMHPEDGLGRSLFSALSAIGAQSGHPELSASKLILLGFSGTGAYFGHFLAYAPDRVLAAILANPGQTDPENVDKVVLDANGVAVPVLIIVGGRDTVGGTGKPYAFYKRHRSQGGPWVYLVQNNIPHCCIINTKGFILDWLQEVVRVRQPESTKPLSTMKITSGWYGSIRVCDAVYTDHWGLPLWNVCDAHVYASEKGIPSGEIPARYFTTEKLAHEWLSYIKQPEHPKNSFPRPDDPSFGEPK